MPAGGHLFSDTSTPTTASRAASQSLMSRFTYLEPLNNLCLHGLGLASSMVAGASSEVSPVPTTVTTPVSSSSAQDSTSSKHLASPFNDNKVAVPATQSPEVSPKTTAAVTTLEATASSTAEQSATTPTDNAVRTLQDVLHDSGTPVVRSNVFPHNFDYETIDSREKLEAYFDIANPSVTIYKKDLDDFEGNDELTLVANALPLLQQAALKGFDMAGKVDHQAGMGDEVKDSKPRNQDWNKVWADFLISFDIPLVQAAAHVGYLVAKRKELVDFGRLWQFFVCDHGRRDPTGCLHNQYKRDAQRNLISDHFGRNRTETDFSCLMMPCWCRKCYQNESYHEENWEKQKCFLIKQTIDDTLAELARLGKDPTRLRFNIELRKRDEVRVVKELKKSGDGAPQAGHKHPMAIKILMDVSEHHCGELKTVADAKALADYAHDLLLDQLAEFKAGKTEKEVSDNMKKQGPRYLEFQLLPKWETVFSLAEIAVLKKEVRDKAEKEKARKAAEASAKGKGKGKGKASPKREADDGSDEEMAEASPSKKARC